MIQQLNDSPSILNDRIYLYCLSLALLSRNDKRRGESYGSVIFKEDQIIGEGVNRAITHPSFKLERIVRQGWVNHAEAEALNDALMNNQDVSGSDLYVAGYFCNSGVLFFHQEYTCIRCAILLQRYNISSIYIPTLNGWEKKKLADAINEARQFSGEVNKKRQEVCIGNHSIEEIKYKLLKPEQLRIS